MDTLLVIIFVFILKAITYFLPAIIVIGMLVIIVGFVLGVKGFLSGKQESIFPDAKEQRLNDIYSLIKRKKNDKDGEVLR